MAMDAKRKGEIALALLRLQAKKDGVRINPEGFKRDIGNIVKKTGVPKEELIVFFEEEVRRLIDEMFTEMKKKQ